MEITYIDRKTGLKAAEKVYGHRSLAFLYGDGNPLQRGLATILLTLFSCFPLFSRLYGFFQKLPYSRHKVKPFINYYGIDEGEFQTRHFASFNDFFTRKLRKECRPIETAPHRLAMPADGRYLVYPQIGSFSIKGQQFDLAAFLQNPTLTRRFQNGSMAIVRLCPIDYHRFHFPCDAVPGAPHLINGFLYSVNPIALKKRLAILSENKRVVTELKTDFGKILYVEIGATAVGSIHQTFIPHQPIRKGDEKGYFEFGGSCLVLLFEKGHVQFDQDLIANSQLGLETLGRFGQGFATLSS